MPSKDREFQETIDKRYFDQDPDVAAAAAAGQDADMFANDFNVFRGDVPGKGLDSLRPSEARGRQAQRLEHLADTGRLPEGVSLIPAARYDIDGLIKGDFIHNLMHEQELVSPASKAPEDVRAAFERLDKLSLPQVAALSHGLATGALDQKQAQSLLQKFESGLPPVDHGSDNPLVALSETVSPASLKGTWQMDTSGNVPVLGQKYAYLPVGEDQRRAVTDALNAANVDVLEGSKNGTPVLIVPEDQLQALSGKNLAIAKAELETTLPQKPEASAVDFNPSPEIKPSVAAPAPSPMG